MKITLLSDDAIRLTPELGQMTIEAQSADQSYSPFHMLGSSLATCTYSVLHSWATYANLRADDLTIDVRWSFADEPRRVDHITLTLDWPSLPGRRLAAAKRVAAMCTIHTTLESGTHIAIESARPAATSPTATAGTTSE